MYTNHGAQLGQASQSEATWGVLVYPDARAACEAQAVCSLQAETLQRDREEKGCMMDMDQPSVSGPDQIYGH